MIYIFYSLINASFQENLFDRFLFTIPEEMQTKIKRYSNSKDQQECLLGQLLIREGFLKLGYPDPLPKIEYNQYGKPYVKGKVDFSISHSGNIVVCAISRQSRVGIDIEEIKKIDRTVFSSRFRPEEWEEIELNKNDLSLFYQHWTKKEAVVKATGKGMYIPLKSFLIKNNHTKIDNQDWYLRKLIIDNEEKNSCHLAVNLKVKESDISVLKFKNMNLLLT